jgi:gentisate 1,2-dioxygenase
MTATPEEAEELEPALLRAGMAPLWTQGPDLMPTHPQPRAVAHVWRWKHVWPLIQRIGAQIAVGEAAQRRAVAFANPGLDGRPYATPTLWAAVQYLAPGESAPSHRHTQSAFRFVLAGDGAATSVDGDIVMMSRGDVILTPRWTWHEHRSVSKLPTMWLDGLDIPLVHYLDAGLYEQPGQRKTPEPWEGGPSRSERLWGQPGIRPQLPSGPTRSSLLVYRWTQINAALTRLLELQRDGADSLPGGGHAYVRFEDPSTARDALPTMRLEMHRLRAGESVTLPRRTGSSIWQVFNGRATIWLDGVRHEDATFADVASVPSWCPMTISADADTGEDLDLFCYSDAPIYEALGLDVFSDDSHMPPS